MQDHCHFFWLDNQNPKNDYLLVLNEKSIHPFYAAMEYAKLPR